MSRILLVMVGFVTPIAPAGEQLTAERVITNLKMGAPVAQVIAQINAPENSVLPLTSAELDQLHAAKVAPSVIYALLTKAAPTASPHADPDNRGLIDLVNLVKSGLSEKIIADQVLTAGVDSKPSLTDLLYLQQNGVSEIIISALMDAPIRTDAAAISSHKHDIEHGSVAGSHAGTSEFAGFVYKRTFRDWSGNLLLEGDKLSWQDSKKSSANFELFLNGVSRIELFGSVRDNGSFIYAINFQFTKGDSFKFEDARKDQGGNEQLMLLIDTLKHRFPKMPFVEKIT